VSFAGWRTLRAKDFGSGSVGRAGRQRRSHGRVFGGDRSFNERRRIAADIHDLVMQDLSFALARARTLADDPALRSQAAIVIEAGERALAGAREVVDGLVDQDRRPVVAAVEAAVLKAARKAPVSFEAVGIQESVRADQPTHDALVHIGREAVTNAIKHAGPGAGVQVVFERDDEWRLIVRDTGRGFALDSTPGGFGLESMRGRVRELGGSLRVTSAQGIGSTIEATLP
jgi:signal transduction histidine kinase